MTRKLICPACNAKGLDLCNYESMMVLRQDLAMFVVACPACGSKVSSLQLIPDQLRDEIDYAAISIGAGMCRE